MIDSTSPVEQRCGVESSEEPAPQGKAMLAGEVLRDDERHVRAGAHGTHNRELRADAGGTLAHPS